MASNSSSTPIRYGECLKNHSKKHGHYLFDGCREFVKSGEDGTKGSYICANCGCIRSFHRMNNLPLHRHQAMRLCFFHHCVIPNGMQPIFHPFMATAGETQVSVSAASLPVTITSNPESVSVQENVPYVMTPPMLPLFPLFPKDEMGPVPVPLPLFPETPSSVPDVPKCKKYEFLIGICDRSGGVELMRV
ncbi:mini zinc finger protein 4 [Nicotiana attenuata]|uniref:Mini zinc finger protein 4 n=1 Tax=Nicotiana attenuata TaxID=49451 RepID=A0A314LBP5_NICAT|nr:mini zinc finger protein 4 [Nicotiana attenuata]